MGLKFYDYDGLQAKIIPPKHFSRQCMGDVWKCKPFFCDCLQLILFTNSNLDDGERIEWPRRLSEAVQLLSGTHHICNKNNKFPIISDFFMFKLAQTCLVLKQTHLQQN